MEWHNIFKVMGKKKKLQPRIPTRLSLRYEFKKTESISNIFSNHDLMKPEIHYMKKLQEKKTHGS